MENKVTVKVLDDNFDVAYMSMNTFILLRGEQYGWMSKALLQRGVRTVTFSYMDDEIVYLANEVEFRHKQFDLYKP